MTSAGNRQKRPVYCNITRIRLGKGWLTLGRQVTKTQKRTMFSKKTKTSCEDDFLSLVDEEIESLSKKKGKKSSSSVKTTPSTSRTSSR